MRKGNAFVDTVSRIVTEGMQHGIVHLYTEDERFTGNAVTLRGKRVVNFGSCSYLGLEFDPRLKQAAQDAIERYGTQFSESRAYVSLTLYKELEELLERMFEAHCVITPTTTLGHIAAIPALVNDEDAVIIDQQVHNSVQTAVNLLKPRGIHVEIVRHSRMDLLEERIIALQAKHAKIWYLADGIYSMFGDECPIRVIYRLLDKYPALHFYVDDAHGMGIRGNHGRGFVLDGRELHPRMVMATSLNKSFASGGGLLVFPNLEWAQKVRGCGGPMITSGPMQPGSLGAAIAAAKIHLSDEIYALQEELHDKIRYTTMRLKKLGLPVVSRPGAAVFYVGLGLPRLGYRLVKKMLDAGYYVNLGIFPAVPLRQTGVRFTITRLHRFAQIEAMVLALARAFDEVTTEENFGLPEIYKAFRLKAPESSGSNGSMSKPLRDMSSLKLVHYTSIEQVDQSEWDSLFAGKGSFDWQGLRSLEQCFSGNQKPEDQWLFDYLVIRDGMGRVIIATFLTTAMWKEDMLLPAEASFWAEEKRKDNPYHLTARVMATGSLLTEGEHIFIWKESPSWKPAFGMLLKKITSLQEQYAADNMVLRDFHQIDPELDKLISGNGFFRISLPETNIVENLHWDGMDGFYQNLSKRSRQHFREDVRKYIDKFEVSVVRGTIQEKDLDSWYRLYLNVQHHSLELNTFPLPRKLFSVLAVSKGWEVLRLTLKTGSEETQEGRTVCVVYCYQSGDAYAPMIIGLDYTYNKQYKVYRQALYQLVMRARQLGKKKVYLGFSASVEKRKVGARQYPTYGYMHVSDTYNMQVLEGKGIMTKPEKSNDL